uniref:CMP/dCMP-type deaminase domain-containing protein n=1 Tax=Acrobeloides nanus TaxID=290746 RepID=A0A914CKA6_9BILA
MFYGAFILKKSDLSLVITEMNNKLECPLWHGEVNCIRRFYELPKETRPNTKDCIFFSSHEPCSLCLSAITWSGFDNFYYLFGHEDTRDSFEMPHDLKIMKEVFNCEPGSYNKKNFYWKCYSLKDMIKNCIEDENERKEIQERINKISKKYEEMFQIMKNYDSFKFSYL